MTNIAHQMIISTSTVIRKHNDFHFKNDFPHLPEMKMNFIAQGFDNLNTITVLEDRTQIVILNHFLCYYRTILYQMEVITTDMFSPYNYLAKLLHFRISRLRLKLSTWLFDSNTWSV